MNHSEVDPWDRGSDTLTPPSPASSQTSNSGGKVRLQLWTDSRQKAHRRCQREEQIRYQFGYVPTSTSDALRFGSLVHKALEAWWGATAGDRLAPAMQAIADALSPEHDPYEIVDAEELIRGYDARWSDEEFDIHAVEAEFRIALLNPETGAASKTFQRAGKIDVVLGDRRLRRHVIMEHKTSGEDIAPGSAYWARLRLDGQVSGYFRGAESLGFKPEACIYDVIGKVKLRPLQVNSKRAVAETPEQYRVRVRESIAENPERYYQRGEVVRLESEMRTYDLETWQQAVQLRESQRLGIAPRNPDACTRFSQVCSYFPVCSGVATLDDTSRYKRLDWAHPELSKEAA